MPDFTRYISLVLLFLNAVGLAQTNQKAIDSLVQLVPSASDSVRFDIYNRMAFYYLFRDQEKSDSILRKSIKEARAKNNGYGETLLTSTLGIQFDVNQEYDSAYYYFDRGLTLSRKRNYKDLESRSVNNLGMNAWNQGQLSKAQTYFFDALRLSEQYFPDQPTDKYHNNIGLIYQELQELDTALEYHNKALAQRKMRGDIVGQIKSYNNIGICNRLLDQFSQAISSYKEAIALAEKHNTYIDYQGIFSNLGNVYLETDNYKEAIKAFTKGKMVAPDGTLDKRDQFFATEGLAYAHVLNGNTKKAEKEVASGLAMLREEPSLRIHAETLYQAASALNFKQGDAVQGATYMDSLQEVLKLRFSDENATALADAETKYQTAQKETDLAKTRATLAETELGVRKRNNIIYGVVGLAILLVLLGYLFYNQQRLKNSQLKKESDLQTALAKIETQNKLHEQRLRISRDLHDNIGSQLTFITSSLDNVRYGMKGETSTTKDKIAEIGVFTKTTINELRDTIWAMNKEFITLEDLEARLGNLLAQARSASPEIDIRFTMSEALDRERALTSVEGVNCYRIIQESVTNAIKYAEASEIKILVEEGVELERELVIRVKDNGRGFDPLASTFGNGLRNMKKRAKDIGAHFEVDSNVSGTTVIVKLPV